MTQTNYANKIKNVVGRIVICGLMLWMSGSFLLAITQEARDGIRSNNWSATSGTITDSTINEFRDPDNNTVRYSPVIHYEYRPDHPDFVGQTLQGERISFRSYSSNTPHVSEELVSRYRAGESVTVYFDPANPNNSVLETGTSLGSVILTGGAAIVLITLGFFAALLLIRGGSSSQK